MKSLLLIIACRMSSAALADNIVFPASLVSPVFNVKTAFGAVGDGVADDTAAIQNAITTYVGTHGRVLYFPNGTYLVGGTLTFSAAIASAKGLTLQGQSQTGVVLRLQDNASGFTDTATPQPVLTTYLGTATNNQAFGNNVFNLTIDTGSGPLFVEDVAGNSWQVNQQSAWRQ